MKTSRKMRIHFGLAFLAAATGAFALGAASARPSRPLPADQGVPSWVRDGMETGRQTFGKAASPTRTDAAALRVLVNETIQEEHRFWGPIGRGDGIG